MLRRLTLSAAAVCGVLLLPVAAADAHGVSGTADCTGVTFNYRAFPGPSSTVAWSVRLDGAPAKSGTYAFTGPTATQFVPLTYSGASAHHITADAWWGPGAGDGGRFEADVSGCVSPPTPPTPPGPPSPPQPPFVPPAPPTPPKPPNPPRARKCKSKRDFLIRVRRHADETLISATATLDGKALKVKPRGGRLTTRIDLRGKKKGSYTAVVRGRYRTASGRVRVRIWKRTYKTCNRHLPPSNDLPSGDAASR